ncbi:MAG TPA: methyl-accepting chemotaxis protein [Meiothermus sp.]|nr:methyl-accepting chemotaxis protein [Meiothermus sp.]
MDRPSKGIFRRRPGATAARAAQKPTAPRRVWLENTPFSVKLAINGAVFVLTSLVLIGAGAWGLSRMSLNLENLYQATLVPSLAISEADKHYADLQRYLQTLLNPDTSPTQRSTLVELARMADEQADAAIEQYGSEWISTRRPQLTRVLAEQGRSDLQELETETYRALEETHKVVAPLFQRLYDQVRAGRVNLELARQVEQGYSQVRQSLQSLIEVNGQFATISNEAAQQDARRARMISWLALAVGLLLGGMLTALVLRSILPRLRALREGAEALQRGQYEHRVAVSGRDEVGVVATTFNAAVEQLQRFIAQQEEEQRKAALLQQNIGEYLGVAMEIAQGDLTRRGRVTEDVLGSVVDAINLVLEELGFLLSEVRSAALKVNQGSSLMNQMTDVVLQGAQAQAQMSQQAQTQTLAVTESIRQMAQRAVQTAIAAGQTLTASQQGQQAVDQTLEGFTAIRREMQELAQSMKELSERSKQIAEVNKTISGFASQTNLLALGASLEAAGAGEAGARFAVVADSVRKLADDSAQAAKQVGSLIRSVQSEIQTLVERVEASAQEVDARYAVATRAGERLKEISELANQVARLVQAISGTTQQQVKQVEQVSQAVQAIAATASQTQVQSSQGRQAAEELSRLAQGLTQSLERFRLPT